jgi:uncharacterized coiled-coil protein SlyX
MRSTAAIFAAGLALGAGLALAAAWAPAARAQQPATGGQQPIRKFKDEGLQQYLVPEIAALQEKLDKMSDRLATMQAEVAKVKEQQQALAADFHTNQELAKATDTSVTSLRASNQEDLLSLKSDVARIRRDVTDLTDQMRKLAVPPAAPAAAAPPPLEGYITQAGASGVTINLGSGSGVRAGMRFGVYRASQPQLRIGTIEVTEVLDANNSRAKIIASNPNTTFEFSDIVRPY